MHIDNASSSSCTILLHCHFVPFLYKERKNGIPRLMEAIWMEARVRDHVSGDANFDSPSIQ
jgi:hypothetical protein